MRQGWGINLLLEGDDDGIVRVEEPRLAGAPEHHQVESLHTTIINHPEHRPRASVSREELMQASNSGGLERSHLGLALFSGLLAFAMACGSPIAPTDAGPDGDLDGGLDAGANEAVRVLLHADSVRMGGDETGVWFSGTYHNGFRIGRDHFSSELGSTFVVTRQDETRLLWHETSLEIIVPPQIISVRPGGGVVLLANQASPRADIPEPTPGHRTMVWLDADGAVERVVTNLLGLEAREIQAFDAGGFEAVHHHMGGGYNLGQGTRTVRASDDGQTWLSTVDADGHVSFDQQVGSYDPNGFPASVQTLYQDSDMRWLAVSSVRSGGAGSRRYSLAAIRIEDGRIVQTIQLRQVAWEDDGILGYLDRPRGDDPGIGEVVPGGAYVIKTDRQGQLIWRFRAHAERWTGVFGSAVSAPSRTGAWPFVGEPIVPSPERSLVAAIDPVDGAVRWWRRIPPGSIPQRRPGGGIRWIYPRTDVAYDLGDILIPAGRQRVVLAMDEAGQVDFLRFVDGPTTQQSRSGRAIVGDTVLFFEGSASDSRVVRIRGGEDPEERRGEGLPECCLGRFGERRCPLHMTRDGIWLLVEHAEPFVFAGIEYPPGDTVIEYRF